MSAIETLPIAVIGAGPVGLAAAAYLVERRLPVQVYEADAGVAANVRDWGHVRLFSPWAYNVDQAAERVLLRHGWSKPCAETMPTGTELHAHYLKPLASAPEMAAVIETGARVTAITRLGADKVPSRDRDRKPFVLAVSRPDGSVRRDLARAVLDASGTWTSPNPLGAAGIAAEGEIESADRIAYGIPDVLGRDRDAYAGKTVLVVGGGHSAANVLLDLARLAETQPTPGIVWAVRGTNLARVYGGGGADQLPARGELGSKLRRLVDTGQVTLVPGFSAARVVREGNGLIVEGEVADHHRAIGPVDRIVVTTGQRPNLRLTRELRVDLDPCLESSRSLGPLIDPNLHSCGSVPPHGHRELAHPEPGFYTVGIKSYGRASTFLMLTGYEQVRSVVAAIAGDMEAADDIQLVLPETGVCSTGVAAAAALASPGCCGGPAPARIDACCIADAKAKAEGAAGCGCGIAA